MKLRAGRRPGRPQTATGGPGLVLILMRGLLPRMMHVHAPNLHVDWSSGSMRLLTGPIASPDRNLHSEPAC
ncbi:hypothetical protein ACQPZQ_32240 [Pseudonocardia sp. CA-142604]|uniref:hypothetical protein n=1 Tax=Pseudonocardia sp. CA-142604 TaxID=3240024 RepID=UPI003D8B1284